MTLTFDLKISRVFLGCWVTYMWSLNQIEQVELDILWSQEIYSTWSSDLDLSPVDPKIKRGLPWVLGHNVKFESNWDSRTWNIVDTRDLHKLVLWPWSWPLALWPQTHTKFKVELSRKNQTWTDSEMLGRTPRRRQYPSGPKGLRGKNNLRCIGHQWWSNVPISHNGFYSTVSEKSCRTS